jgi:bacterioferritin-associated ferredoxin
VSDDEIERAVDAGADTVAAVSRHTGAGTCCGTCHDLIEEIIEVRCRTCPLAALSVA